MSGLEPGILAAIIGGGASLASSIFGGGGAGGGAGGGSFFQGAEMQPQAMVPPGFEDAYKMAGQLAMQRMQEPQYVAPINPLSMGGANIVSQFYMGQPYQQPGLMQYRPGQGGLGAPGMGQPQMPSPGMGGMPMPPMPRQGMQRPGMPMPGMPSPGMGGGMQRMRR